MQAFTFPAPESVQVPDRFPTKPANDHASTSHRSGVSSAHRHARSIGTALETLKVLSDQAITPAKRLNEDEQSEEELRGEGIIANLASYGWTHQTTKNGIRIFRLDVPDGETADGTFRSPLDGRMHVTGGLRNGVTSPGMEYGARAADVLPFFRGEGWIEGSWKREDVAATIASLGARAVWDPRFEQGRSHIVELLSETDTLLHMYIRGQFVADRDASMVMTIAADDRPGREDVLFVAGCSVDDALVPASASRTSVILNGFALRSLPRPPHFEPPPLPQLPAVNLAPTRPAHRRTKSSASVLNVQHTFLAPQPPLPSSLALNSFSAPLHAPQPPAPPPLKQALSTSTLASSIANSPPEAESAFPFPLTTVPSIPKDIQSRYPVVPPANRPGLAVSMVIRARPGYNLPHSMLQQLSVHLPLSIASIGRFLSTQGFAPYLVRDFHGIRLREEAFDAASAKYHVIFSLEQSGDDEIKIRFFGGTFGGRFDVEIEHVKPGGWRIEYDVAPASLDIASEHTEKEVGGSGSGRWKAKVIINADRSNAPQQRGRPEDSPLFPDDGYADMALSPGPFGGCTLVIDALATTPHLPVVVTITRSCTVASQPLARIMRGRSKALAQAAQVALSDNSASYGNSLEEFLASGREGDERAELLLRGAKVVMQELERASQEESRGSSRFATSALFGEPAWSPRSTQSRKLGRAPSSLSLRFANT
ncbi:uncharacterized protein JCM15063_004049 [Sporobolomyces koalae]|uniref:uncharacterized protein n=1 Tax=Sporobolomyces koalae TaxID=500713 RepID=UPI00317EAA06